jgi:hypothetical protein
MSIGKISEFNVRTDSWKMYVERLEQYFVVNEIKVEKQVPTLITVMGAECYELLVNLCTPDKPTNKTFKQLTDILEQYLQPKPSILSERYKFRHRKQNNETISEYVAVLKKMSKTCEFGSWLEDSLRDQLVCGISSETIRQRLFTEDQIDFRRAYALAVSMEAAEKDAAAVEGRAITSCGDGAACQAVSAVGAARRDGGGGAGGGRARFSVTARGRSMNGWRGQHTIGQQQPRRGVAYQQCRACGANHDVSRCQFARYVCKVCNKQGHLRRVCPNLVDHHNVDVAGSAQEGDRELEDSDEVMIKNVHQLSVSKCSPIIITLKVNGKDLKMECDTGSAVSCISYKLYLNLFRNLELIECSLKLRYYTGELIKPKGLIKPLVCYNGVKKYLDLYVIENAQTTLLGRQWLISLNLQLPNFADVNKVSNIDFNISDFSSRYCEVFAEGLGRFTGGRVSIHVREGARPVFMRARPLAYALRAPVENALDQMVRDGILTPVDRSDWATPIVPVVKKDGDIRICADYKLTLNRVIEVDRYPLPKVEDLLARLHGGEKFSKIDLSQAYSQFELDETKKYTVINTHKGLFMYNRLVFGLSSSPGIFQKRLEQLFADIPYVGVFLDDIIISGRGATEHIGNLHTVFQRLQAHGLRIKKEKCSFFQDSVKYLGHVINKDGVAVCHDKVKAILNTPSPTNVSELRAFIGMVMYYAKFLNNVSTILAPLYNLLRIHVKFEWSKECEKAFSIIKHRLASSEVLVHYSLDQPLILTADASGVGVGAIISHLTPDGERPVAYASRSLTTAERSYAQIDREALAIIYGIRKFHQYIYGRKFLLRTDHKPLTYIFGNKVGIPVMAASRLQRWAVLLSGYNYDIEYVASNKNCADALSRMPQTGLVSTSPDEIAYTHFVEQFLPITNNEVRLATSKDSILSRVVIYVQTGWPNKCTEEQMKHFYNKRNELYVERGCLMWGYRMVIPTILRKKVLMQLHVSHMGIVKTKSLARSYVWWPNIDTDLEMVCKNCETCAAEAQAPPRATPQPWPYYSQPWSRIHLDFLGPLNRSTYLILLDATTKWLEVFEMTKTNAACVIKLLRATFARFGLPLEVVSDQGPPFTSSEFRNFLINNGIVQSFSPAYHPASNGAAENAVKLCKRAIKKAIRESIDVEAALQSFLLNYRNSIHSSTGDTPAMLLQRRSLRSRLDLLRSETAREQSVQRAQQRQRQYSSGSVPRTFAPGDPVWVRVYNGPNKWKKGTVTAAEGSRRYLVDNGNGQFVQRHVDQVTRRSRMSDVPCPSTEEAIVQNGSEDVVGNSVMEKNDSKAVNSEIEEGQFNTPSGSPYSNKKSASSTPQREFTPPLSHSSPSTPLSHPKRPRKPVLRYGIDY